MPVARLEEELDAVELQEWVAEFALRAEDAKVEALALEAEAKLGTKR